MIAKHTGGGKLELAPMAVVSLVVVIIGAGIYVGTHVSGIKANAEGLGEWGKTHEADIRAVEEQHDKDVDKIKDAMGKVHTLDRRLVLVESGLSAVQTQNIDLAKTVNKNREVQVEIQTNQRNLSRKLDGVAKGVNEIKTLIRALGPPR